MYTWFWSLLKVFGIEVRMGDLDMTEVNPLDVPWSAAHFNFNWFGRRIGGDDGE